MSKLTLYNKNFSSPAQITDEVYLDLGASAVILGEIKRAFKGGADMVIRTASGGGGTLLVENTDYTLEGIDTRLTADAGFNVYSTVTIINVTFQTGALYFTYKAINSYDDANFANATALGWRSLSSILLTYASASTITTGSDLTGDLSVGMKLRITQTTDKYFDIVAINATTITVDAGTTYTVANAAITSPAYSTEETPFGWDTDLWDYTPVLTGITIGNGATVGQYKRISHKTVSVRIQISFGSTTSITGSVSLTTPSVIDQTAGNPTLSPVALKETGVLLWVGSLSALSATEVRIQAMDGSTTYTSAINLSSSIPFTWADTDIIEATFIYKEA